MNYSQTANIYSQKLKEPEFKGEVIEPEEEKLLLEKAELSKAPWLKLGIILGITPVCYHFFTSIISSFMIPFIKNFSIKDFHLRLVFLFQFQLEC